MTQEQFEKAPLLDQILYDKTGLLIKYHPSIADAMEKYHRAKLKLLRISANQQREMLIDFLDELKPRDYMELKFADIVDDYLKSKTV